MAAEISLEGIENVAFYFDRFPEVSNKAAQLSINTVAQRTGLRLAKKEMQDQVMFPRGYLDDRLTVSKRARSDDLEAIIVGRKRATSLARFASENSVRAQPKGVRIRVSRGRSTYMKKAFIVRLKRGASLDEDNYNLGLALALDPGESVHNKKRAHQSWLVKDRVALLYGPSVDQVFRSVSEDIAPEVGRELGVEFMRQFRRLSSS